MRRKATPEEVRQKVEMAEVLRSESGRSVLRRIAEWCGVFDMQGLGKAEDLYFAQGRRSVGLQLAAAMYEADRQAAADVMVRGLDASQKPRKERTNDEELDA